MASIFFQKQYFHKREKNWKNLYSDSDSEKSHNSFKIRKDGLRDYTGSKNRNPKSKIKINN